MVPLGSALERITATQRLVARGQSSRVVDIEGGFVALNDAVPASYDHNSAWLVEPTPDPGALVARLDEVMGGAGLRHRRMTVQSPQVGAVWVAGLGAGWERGDEVLMALAGEPDRPARGQAVELSWPDVRESYVASWRRSLPAAGPEVWRQLADRRDETARACLLRHFAVVVDGKVVARAELRLSGRTGQVEDVETVEAYRGRGYAREIVLAAAAAASDSGADLCWLVADARDWPRLLYVRLGFVEVGGATELTRAP